eukprot:TRINITY_DN12856_c0_g1_i10.p2 TRINITY_DN12856_c0_g1~~TRINITY_DN12856_c0_g1_i10.p2  ORF type:complete len:138 (+),score=33.74 TRINITY_DN12856_c0_g1_i10:150-563(+)
MQSSGAAGKGKESGGGGGSRRGVAAPNFCTSCGTKGGWQRRAAGLCDSVEAAEEGSREVREAAAWALEQAESFQVDMPAARWKAVESLSRRGQQPWHAQALESDASRVPGAAGRRSFQDDTHPLWPRELLRGEAEQE